MFHVVPSMSWRQLLSSKDAPLDDNNWHEWIDIKHWTLSTPRWDKYQFLGVLEKREKLGATRPHFLGPAGGTLASRAGGLRPLWVAFGHLGSPPRIHQPSMVPSPAPHGPSPTPHGPPWSPRPPRPTPSGPITPPWRSPLVPSPTPDDPPWSPHSPRTTPLGPLTHAHSPRTSLILFKICRTLPQTDRHF